jgi:regulator of replication initiation timing
MGSDSDLGSDSERSVKALPRFLGRIAEQTFLVFLNQNLPVIITGVLLACVFVFNRISASAYSVGASVALFVVLVVVLLTRLVRWGVQSLRLSQAEALVELGAQLDDQVAANRDLARENAHLRMQVAEGTQAKEDASRQQRKRRKLKAKIEDLEAENHELASLAQIGKDAIIVNDIRRGWEAAASHWPKDMPPDERVWDFVVSELRPGLADLQPNLVQAGIAVIAREDGIYRLISEDRAPRVLKMVSPKPATHPLPICLKKLGVADYTLTEIPGRPSSSRTDWFAVFEPIESEQAFQSLMSTGGRILASLRQD